jgi:hypothetical protein
MDLAHHNHKEQSKLKSKENQQFFKRLKKVKTKDELIYLTPLSLLFLIA